VQIFSVATAQNALGPPWALLVSEFCPKPGLDFCRHCPGNGLWVFLAIQQRYTGCL